MFYQTTARNAPEAQKNTKPVKLRGAALNLSAFW